MLHNPHLDGRPFLLEAGETAVILVHGYTATPWEVRPLADRLHAQGYTVAGPLLAGHGTRAADLNRVRWRDWAEGSTALLHQLSARHVHLFVAGQSTGGLVALWLAAHHPQIAGVIGYAPAIQLTLSRAQRVALRLLAPFVSELKRGSLDCADNWQGYPGLPLRGALQLLAFQKALRKRLDRITQPVLIFQGRRDSTVHPDAGKMILQRVRSAHRQHVWLAQTSHAVTLDAEIGQVAAVTSAFLQLHSAGL
jgi:carboxylesterase